MQVEIIEKWENGWNFFLFPGKAGNAWNDLEKFEMPGNLIFFSELF